MRGGKYGGVLVAAMACLGAAAALAFVAVQQDGPAAAGVLPPDEGTRPLPVRDVAHVRPAAADYARFATEDSAWRRSESAAAAAADSAAMRGAFVTSVSGGEWAPSPEQAMRDRVFTLVQDGRLAEAASELGRWTLAHPRDGAAWLELARLLARLDRGAEASAAYSRRLALGDDGRVRREYAAHLLASGDYPAASREFEALVRQDGDDAELRLGLARALAWGGRPQEAEPQFRWLLERQPGDTTLLALVRSARMGYDPVAADAAAWLAAEPGHAPYRLALARALVREGRAYEAAAHYDTLLVAAPTVVLLSEAAGARSAARDSVGAARLLGRAVLLSPGDDRLRQRWAEALAWSGDASAAIAQYTLLIDRRPTAELLLARGRLHAWGGRLTQAERDLAASAAAGASYEALSLLGDVRRWLGRHRSAREAYERALALRPGDPLVLASLASLAHEERMLAGAGAATETGWSALASYAEDNAGFLYLSGGVSRGIALGRETIVSAFAEQRRISQRSAVERERYVYGYAVGLGASRWIGAAVRATVRAGYVRHGVADDVMTGGAELAANLRRRVRVSLSAERAPAYRELMSLRSLARGREAELRDARVLVGTGGRLSVAVPVGRAEISATVEELRLSDGNRRRAVSAGARLPIGGGFSAVYAGSALGFSDRTEMYWDPERYTAHSAGVEFQARPSERLAVSARVMPGIGRSTEAVVVPGGGDVRLSTRTVGQLSAGGELSYRRGNLNVSAGGGYGRGRDGGYQSLNGTLRVRLAW